MGDNSNTFLIDYKKLITFYVVTIWCRELNLVDRLDLVVGYSLVIDSKVTIRFIFILKAEGVFPSSAPVTTDHGWIIESALSIISPEVSLASNKTLRCLLANNYFV